MRSVTTRTILNSLAPPTALQLNMFVIPFHSGQSTHRVNYRASVSIGGSSVFISVQTKGSASHTKSRSRRGCNGTIESMPRRTWARPTQMDSQAHDLGRIMKAGHQEGTTRCRKGVAATWDFTVGHLVRMQMTRLSKHVSPHVSVARVTDPLTRTSSLN